jgi:phosphoglycerol transferase MdoB-like AlkP superfamily enzyme
MIGLELLFIIFLFKMNRKLIYTILTLLTLFFISNYVYYQVYDSIISLASFINGKQVLEFYDKILEVIINNIFIIILFIIPLIIVVILDINKIIEFNSKSSQKILYILVVALLVRLSLFSYIHFLDNNARKIYNNESSAVLLTKEFGLINKLNIDLTNNIFGDKKDIISTDGDVDIEPVKEYNMMDIDFTSLAENETNESIKTIYNYFNSQTPTEKNVYTGMFKGKNLIVFVAEAFSDIAINKDATPNLYKLYNEGFQFKNFYTPIFPVSTADGEFITDTSLIPMENEWSTYRIKDNFMPFSYANLFENIGYTSQAFHDHSATYYNRDLYIAAMGYNSYKACKMNLNIDCTLWPESDLEMMHATIDDYINDEHFLSYYMSVSGHLLYTRTGNAMVRKNWDVVSNLAYSDKAKGYLAAQLELDKAIGYTIERLTEAGKLNDTVIMISADHYPYGLTLDEINELSSYIKDDTFEKHRNELLIWSGDMEKPIEVDKIASSLDVLPTILNLFGIEYDSRMLMGRDILSPSKPLVIYSNRSFITDLGRYNSIKQIFSSTVEGEYVNNVLNSINNKYIISKSIIQNDFYRVLYKALGKV